MTVTRWRTIGTWAAPAGVSLFLVVFLLARGTVDSMWFDEAFSWVAAKRSLPSLLEFVATKEPNMGPYYLALWPWIRIDDGDLWVRALSTSATIAAVWAVWAVARRWSGPGVAAVAAIVFGLTPFILGWSMQARGYTMAMAFTAWSLLFADRVRAQEGRWSGVWFGAMVGLAVASQFATAFVFPGILIVLLALAPTRFTVRSLVMAGFTAAAVFAPFSIAAFLKPDHADWVPELTTDYFGNQFLKAASGPWWPVLIASGVVCLLVGSVRSVQVRPYLMALAGATSGFVGLVLVSHFVRPMFVSRYLIGCLPLVIIAAVGGWSLIWPRWRTTTAALVIGASLLILGTSIDRTRPAPEDFRSASAVVEDGLRPGDAIVAIGEYSILGVVRYLPEGTPTQKLRTASDRPGSWVVIGERGEVLRPQRLWIVQRNFPTTELDSWIRRSYPVLVLNREFGSIRLQLRSVA